LLVWTCFGCLQNLDIAGLTCKILQNKGLARLKSGFAWHIWPRWGLFRVFWTATRKILISKNLNGIDRRLRPQNLERLRLTRKILQNKHLAQGLEIAATPFGCGDDRIFVLWTTRADVTLPEGWAVEKSRYLAPG